MVAAVSCMASNQFKLLPVFAIEMDMIGIDSCMSSQLMQNMLPKKTSIFSIARLAQSAERKALNLVVVGSSPTVGVLHSFSKLCCLFA